MREQRLLERIESWNSDADRSNASNVELLMVSVMDHLRRILNTRQGTVLINPEYGLPDFTNVAGSFASGSTSKMEVQIGDAIRQWEPRLKRVTVKFTPKDEHSVLVLYFAIAGVIEVDNKEIPLNFETTISSDGKIMLSK